MTQPYQQYGQPQPYPQQYGQPQPYPQQTPPPPAGVSPNGGAPAGGGAAQSFSFVDPAVLCAGDFSKVKIRDLGGRAVLVSVESYDEVPSALKAGTIERRVRLNVLVLDGGPLMVGGTKDNNFTATHRIEAPHYAESVLSSHANIVGVLKQYAGTGALVPGRIERGKARDATNSNPWNFVPLSDTMSEDLRVARGYGPERVRADAAARELAAQIWSARLMGSWRNPEPVELGNPYAAQQPQQQYQQASAMPQYQPQPQPQPQYQPQAPAMQQQQAFAGMQQPQYQLQPQQQAFAGIQQQAPAMPQQPSGLPCPPNWTPDVWVGLTDAQQQQVLASLQNAQAGGAPGF